MAGRNLLHAQLPEGGDNVSYRFVPLFEEVVTAEIDPALVESVRKEFSFLDNRVFR